MSFNGARLLALLVTATLVGCSTLVETTKHPGKVGNNNLYEATGVTYFLPRRRVEISVTASHLSITDEQVKKAKGDVSTATSVKNEADKSVKAAEAFKTEIDKLDNEDAKREAAKALEVEKARLGLAKNSLAKAKSDLDALLATPRQTSLSKIEKVYFSFGTERVNYYEKEFALDKAEEECETEKKKCNQAGLALGMTCEKASKDKACATQVPTIVSKAQAVEEAKTELEEARRKVAKAQDGLMKILANPDGSTVCTPLKYSVTLKLLAPEPDPDYTYVASLPHNPLRDDLLTITVDEKGLLSTTKATGTDQTGQILIEIAKFISASAVGAGTPVAAARLALPPSPVKCPLPFTYNQVFDPSSGNDVNKVTSVLMEKSKNGLRLAVHGKGLSDSALDPPPPPNYGYSMITPVVGKAKKPVADRDDTSDWDIGPTPLPQCTMEDKSPAAGLLYRRALPYVIAMEQHDPGRPLDEWYPIEAVLVMLPNAGPVAVVPFEASPFVKTVYDVEFKDGMVTKWDANRPSEALAVVRLPLALLKAVISAPAEIIKLRVDLSNENKKLIDAQKAQMEAQEAIRDLEREKLLKQIQTLTTLSDVVVNPVP